MRLLKVTTIHISQIVDFQRKNDPPVASGFLTVRIFGLKFLQERIFLKQSNQLAAFAQIFRNHNIRVGGSQKIPGSAM